jgi:two-component system, OmpR family, phosphate regulon sensor histidine kinase PhoR
MRAALALFLTLALALTVYQTGGGTLPAFAVAAAGILAVILMSAGGDPEPLQTSPTETPSDDGESAIINAISEPVLLVTDGRVRLANVDANALLGTHITGEDVRLAIRHPAAAEHLTPDSPDGVVELAGIGGRERRHDMHVTTLRPGTRLIHLIDRSARHAVDRARTDFVANASHELRTPLAAILGFIETLRDEKAGEDPVTRARFLTVMDTEARRMQRLIDDLISLSRIESEKHALPDTRVALPALIRRVAGEIGNGNAGALQLELDDSVVDIPGDDAQLSQLVHNLVGNAMKYGRAGAPVTIALKPAGNGTRLSVTDHGDGIAAEHLPRLTERFYRVDDGRSRGLGGTGLGLAIVKHIVERHRGRLDIASTVGTGTTVTVTFPGTFPAVTQTSPN